MTGLLEDPRVMALQTSWRPDLKALLLRIAKGIVRDGDAGLEQGPAQRRIERAL
jgi:hypothetical protein